MSERSREFLIALAGNPNCGKTTLFNEITGARQHVGNYPGITVEKKEGSVDFNGNFLKLVDLPGIYSLTAYSPEELVAREFLVTERPHVVVNIVDASNLERNLYLTVQLLELGVPIVIALNMIDVADQRGIHINVEEFSKRLQLPIIPTIAKSGKGKNELLKETVEFSQRVPSSRPFSISYGPDIDPVLDRMEKEIIDASFLTHMLPARWTALKYLEADEEVMNKGHQANPELARKLQFMADEVTEHLRKTLDTYPEAIIADHRYGFISALLKDNVLTRSDRADRLYFSDQLDKVLTNRLFGPLIMLLILYTVYQFTFKFSEVPINLMEAGFGALGRFMAEILPQGPIKSLVVSGIINGIGGILGFVPLVLFMFFCIAFLEDTGYLARVAYMLDRVFRTFGLHGNSVMAFIISGGIAGGCAVPGVLATRTLRSSKERLATLLTAPFMNCGAKLPVFAMLIAAFFPTGQAQVMFFLTLLSWAAALLLARLIRSTILRGPSTPFLLELPPYRMPTLKGLIIHTWERTWQYIRKAGTIILCISIVFWALMTYPSPPETHREHFAKLKLGFLSGLPDEVRSSYEHRQETADDDSPEIRSVKAHLALIEQEEAQAALKYSVAGRIGVALEKITAQCGFDWRTNVALLAGFAAKELIVATMGTAYSLGNSDEEDYSSLSDYLSKEPGWDRLRAFSLIVFIMLYAPCMATVICIIKESGSWRWGLFSLVFNTTVAWLMATLIYQSRFWFK